MEKKWTEELATGVLEIDSQHKEFISALNSLLEAMSQGKGRPEAGRLLDFLGVYVEKHFGLEEEYMRRFMYPAYEEHRNIHAAFLKEMRLIQDEFRTSGASISLVLKVQRNMLDWLIVHINQVDKKLGAFLKGKV